MTNIPDTVGGIIQQFEPRRVLDLYDEERQMRLWQRQRSFRRTCFYLCTGFFLVAGIVIYHFVAP